jgi:hypothetical protein
MGRKAIPAALRRKQFNLLLSDEMRARLEKRAKENDRPVSEEVRERIRDTLVDEEWFDPSARWLGDEVKILAREVLRQTGYSWRRHPKSYEVLLEAITTLLEQVRPGPVEGEDKWGADDPRTLGRAVVRTRRNLREMVGRLGADHKKRYEDARDQSQYLALKYSKSPEEREYFAKLFRKERGEETEEERAADREAARKAREELEAAAAKRKPKKP